MPFIEVRMPEDDTEGTEASVGVWLRQPGDSVVENEPLVEINTDKVTIEIAAPAGGILGEQRKATGDPVKWGELLGLVETGATGVQQANGTAASPALLQPPSEPATPLSTPLPPGNEVAATFSPVVRRLLAELGLDARAIPKVGRGGRLTPEDVRCHLAAERSAPLRPAASSGSPPSFSANGSSGRRVDHTPMRKSIASHMARSVQTAPHVTAVFEADLYNVFSDRQRRKQASGTDSSPTITAYLIRAAVRAIKLIPVVNSKWHDTHLEIFDDVNFGVGTALESGGLIVPVLRNADQMDLPGLSQNLREMTQKARNGKCTQADLEGGTFTLSNHGVGGSLWAAPIVLPHGQAAILGAGKVQKRVIVCETGGRELFRIRPMMYVTLTIDHRVLDGQQADAFLTAFVAALENPEV
jgi:2-oxoglutarate dehydrogenase E2 component (dihydrolipoamide succinyltransferase)